ncbi:hypothetical protein SUDANB95_07928 (plasmid) [Actinosynnema sp. ALI-1.44]
MTAQRTWGLPIDPAVEEAGLIVLVGPPGAGKTELRNRHLPNVPVVHLDSNRALISPFRCEADQDEWVTATAVQMALAEASRLLAVGRRVVWDATSAVRADRMVLQVLAAEHAVSTAAVVLLPALELCLERNRRRNARACPCGFSRRVPEEIVAAMHEQIALDLPTLPEEGWDLVLADVAEPIQDREDARSTGSEAGR